MALYSSEKTVAMLGGFNKVEIGVKLHPVIHDCYQTVCFALYCGLGNIDNFLTHNWFHCFVPHLEKTLINQQIYKAGINMIGYYHMFYTQTVILCNYVYLQECCHVLVFMLNRYHYRKC